MSSETVLVADGDPRSLRLLELALRRAGDSEPVNSRPITLHACTSIFGP